MSWRILVPIKAIEVSKTRLSGVTQRPADHPDLVRALQLDTLWALAGLGDLLAGIYVVSSEDVLYAPPKVHRLSDHGGGLNSALATAASEIQSQFPDSELAAVVGDLPALRPEELRAALQAATGLPRAFVADRTGVGTTMLTVGAGVALQPMFGRDSAARHRGSGAIELPAGPSVRTDVDTAEDLALCLQLGVGPRTAALSGMLVDVGIVNQRRA